MRTLSQEVGAAFESSAHDYLKSQGLKFVVANYKCKCGEIDLIMLDGDTMVFIEVRHRKNHSYGDGIDTITKTKQRKIILSATVYLQKNRLLNKIPCRFDIVANNGNNGFKWIKNAFWEKW